MSHDNADNKNVSGIRGIFIFDEPYYLRSTAEGIESHFDCEVCITPYLDIASMATEFSAMLIFDPRPYFDTEQNSEILELLKRHKSVPKYALSTASKNTLEKYGYILGNNIDLYSSKPCSPAEIYEKIKQFINPRSMLAVK